MTESKDIFVKEIPWEQLTDCSFLWDNWRKCYGGILVEKNQEFDKFKEEIMKITQDVVIIEGLRSDILKSKNEINLDEAYKKGVDKVTELNDYTNKLPDRYDEDLFYKDYPFEMNNYIQVLIGMEISTNKLISTYGQKKIEFQLDKVENNMLDLNKLKDNLFNFFGIIIGILAFIFVNFQLITNASSLNLGKMIVFLGISNIVLIAGILIIMNFLSLILKKPSIIGIIFSVGIILLGLHFSKNIIEQGVSLNKKIVESDTQKIDVLEKEITNLKNEIENLKNKK